MSDGRGFTPKIDAEETNMGYAELIARELENLPLDKQAEVLDFIGYLKTRQDTARIKVPQTAEEIEAFFRSFSVDVRGYKFDREEANAR
jgi:hypothetical protein